MSSGTPDPDGSDCATPAAVRGDSVRVETNGVRLHTVLAGPEDGPLVLLLHGFPEFWYGWRDQIRPLANAGFRVAVPDQRGYNLSEKPAGVDAYRIGELAADAVGLIDALGRERASVVGHDWGAIVGWWLALNRPDRLDRLAALNVPHPTVFRRTLKRSWRQRLKSAYAAFFQLPRLPEAVLRAGDFRALAWLLRETSDPGAFVAADLDRYREAWSRPGALTAMLNWYRASARENPHPRRKRVTTPTLVLWGARDVALERSMARESVRFCEDGRLRLFEDATHWLHHEEPVRVAEELIEFLEA